MPCQRRIDQDSREQQGKRVVLKVLDEGNGIPAKGSDQDLRSVFHDQGQTRTGLGLSIARGVLARLGGDITAENRPEGGACFTLSFPLHRSRADRRRQGRRRFRRWAFTFSLSTTTPKSLEATRMAMEREGQQVDIAQNGRDAIERIRLGARYDLVLCDLGMPDMNGWHVAREIQDVAPGTSVFMVTGWAQQIARDDPRRRW